MEPNTPAMSAVTQGGVTINVATTFFPTARLPGAENIGPDTILFTRDGVFFYVHKDVLRSRSSNYFGNILPTSDPQSSSSSQESNRYTHLPGDQVHREGQLGSSDGGRAGPKPLLTINVREHSVVINVILHVIYDMSCRRFGPDLSAIAEALDALDRYGIQSPPETSTIWSLVLEHARTQPIRAYALAASRSLESMAVAISPYTLAVQLNTVTEADALTMGPLYLRRMFFLHIGRREALKRVIESPPAGHRLTARCSAEDQAVVVRSWELAVTDAVLRPMQHNLSADELRSILGTTVQGRACAECIGSIRARISEAVQAWQAIKTTI